MAKPIEAPPWPPVAAPIWRLVAGYAPRIRRSRLDIFRYSIRGFDLSALSHATANLAHETERDKKLQKLAAVVTTLSPFPYYVSVSKVAFARLFQPHAPYGLAKPHFTCVFTVAAAIVRHLESEGIMDAKVEFIFDRQDEVSADIGLLFDDMLSNLSPKARAMVADAPRFLDDRDYLPLQAADMFAWCLRREHEQYPVPLPLAKALRGHEWIGTTIEADFLVRLAKAFKTMPGVPLLQTKAEWKGTRKEIDGAKGIWFFAARWNVAGNVRSRGGAYGEDA